jgi:type I restriction enzyme S subunit
MIDGLRPYPDMRPTGTAWLGHVPVNWETVRTRYIFREIDQRSTTGDETHLSMSQRLGSVPVAEVEQRTLVSESYVGGKLVKENDLVLNRLKAHLGVFTYAKQAGVISPDYSVFRPNDDVNVRFCEFVLKSLACRSELRTRAKGIVEGFWRLYTDDFYDIRLPVPPPDEQGLIVRFLDWHGARTAKLIRANKRLIGLLNEQKQAFIHRAITRGLDPNVRLISSGVPWLGDVPEGWELKRLKAIARNVIEQKANRANGEIYIALEHIESWSGRLLQRDFESQFDSQVKAFSAGDILFGKLRPYLAKVTRLDVAGVCVGEILVVRASEAVIDPAFLECRLRTSDLINLVNSSTFGAKMPRANWDFIGSIKVAFPRSLSEQQQIVEFVRNATAELTLAGERISDEIALLQEFRARLIADVVTGKLDVRAAAAGLPEVIEEPSAVDEIEEAETRRRVEP